MVLRGGGSQPGPGSAVTHLPTQVTLRHLVIQTRPTPPLSRLDPFNLEVIKRENLAVLWDQLSSISFMFREATERKNGNNGGFLCLDLGGPLNTLNLRKNFDCPNLASLWIDNISSW